MMMAMTDVYFCELLLSFIVCMIKALSTRRNRREQRRRFLHCSDLRLCMRILRAYRDDILSTYGRDVGRQMVVARSNCSRIEVES